MLFSPILWPFSVVFRSVLIPRQNESAADYQTQIALIAGTNWKESIPGARCICLPVQKWASHLIRQRSQEPLSAADYLTQRSITLCEDSVQMRRHSRQKMSGKRKEKKTKKKQPSERPRGKSSAKTDGNSAEQLMHSSVWLGQDLRDHETLVEKEAERERGLRHCCLHHFAQFLTVLSVLALAYWAFCRHP